MTLHPLANLIAVHDPNPSTLEETLRNLLRSGEFACVWQPAPGWVAASAPLPDGAPDDDMVRAHQFAFAEGRDLLVENSGQEPVDALHHIAELADQNPDRLATLPGDFGFIRFRTNGEATVVRSCGGLIPFYLWRDCECRAIATRLGDLVRYVPNEFRLDPLVNAIWSVGWGIFPNDRTFLDGVTILPRGHFARLNGQTHIERYWNPRPKHIAYPTPTQAREHAERLRTILIAKLTRDLDPEGDNLLSLSGGVDSTSLAALAAGVVGRKVSTFTVLPSQENRTSLEHELSFIAPLAQEYGLARRWEIHYYPRLSLDLCRSRHLASPIVFPILHPTLCSLPGILHEAPVRVLFGGEFADEMCGSAFTVPDWVRHTSLGRLVLDSHAWIKQPRIIARWARHRWATLRGKAGLVFPRDLLEMDLATNKPRELFQPTVRQEYLAWWDGKKKELLQDSDSWRYLAMDSATMDPFVPMNWEACSALGVRRSFPFFNREIFELAYECHPTELYGPGTKKLLRAALHNDVPARNLYRQDKGGWGIHERKRKQSLQESMPEKLPIELEQVISPEWFSAPPTRIAYLQFNSITRLVIFVESLRSRQKGKSARKEPPRSSINTTIRPID